MLLCACNTHIDGGAQGEQLGDHYQLGKLGFFRQSYEIPLIIRDPRPSADGGRGARVDAYVHTHDMTLVIIMVSYYIIITCIVDATQRVSSVSSLALRMR
jgi:hypothetical protein